MGLKRTIRKQYQSIVYRAATAQLKDLKQPAEGWIVSVRNALGMSAAQLARRINRTRANISAAERSEQEGRATIQSMKTLAEAMECKFVYAIIPVDGDIGSVLERQARKKAKALVNKASTHMALEKQGLDEKTIHDEVERITCDLMEDINSDFWNDDDD
jgi:predicted DNA-binding mobile mystery protein A